MSERNSDLFRRRYPNFSEMHLSTLIYGGPIDDGDAYFPLEFQADIKHLWLVDVMMMADWNQRVRSRYFQAAVAFRRDLSSSELTRQLTHRFPIGKADLVSPSMGDDPATLRTSANFAALAAVDRIGETTITTFLDVNAQFLVTALGGVRLIPQPRLEWLEGNHDDDEVAIQPDFLLVDQYGEAHICEVKLPLLARDSLTTGGQRRRRFVSSVGEGIAQLANYREYLTFARHQRLVVERYGVKVTSPRSILIVGSEENFDAEEVRQAQRALAPVEIVDYDSLRALYVLRSGYPPQY